MKPSSSLRSRVLFGSVLWSLGLFVVASLTLTQLMLRYPDAPRMVHDALSHVGIVSVVALLCLALGAWQVRRGLTAIGQLRTRLGDVRGGRDQKVAGTYPTEVQPLVDDLNSLLEQREKIVQRALAKAGDLAHGLKTPLAVLGQEVERAERAGHTDVASAIGQQVDRMRRQIDYHLAHARAAAAGPTLGARTEVKASADALARTLHQLHADRGLVIDSQVSPAHAVRCQREDLDEMIGNLMDNACKWARSRVIVTSSESSGFVTIVVDDDGPGLPPAMRAFVLQRGARIDEALPGSGLGLAIVRDLAEVYGGSISLETSSGEGLSARLSLPACSTS
jgi:signal transduction histidine kinase